MSWVITGSEKTPVDPQFGSVSLLLHGEGNTIVDSSGSPKTITPVGQAATSTAEKKFGDRSIVFDGTGDGLSITGMPIFGLRDFTVEYWVYNTRSSPSRYFIGSSGDVNTAGGIGIFWQDNSSFIVRINGLGGVEIFATPHALNQWVHVAVARQGTTVRLFFNGTQAGTVTKEGNITRAIGAIGYSTASAAYDMQGNLDEVRVTDGVARYTANFTPPTAPFPDI
jgi:hypothetical protein